MLQIDRLKFNDDMVVVVGKEHDVSVEHSGLNNP